MTTIQGDADLTRYRHRLIAAGAALLLLSVIGAYGIVQSRQNESARQADVKQQASQIDALADAVDSLRQQVWGLGETPAVPSSDALLANPDVVAAGQPQVNTTLLTSAARSVLTTMVPSEVESEVAEAVKRYTDACAASGRCVGPAGPAGAAGKPGVAPSTHEVTTAVLESCTASGACVVDPEEIASAVAAYCSQDSTPCGDDGWTEREIEHIAEVWTLEYLSGRKVYSDVTVTCPPPAAPDEPTVCTGTAVGGLAAG